MAKAAGIKLIIKAVKNAEKNKEKRGARAQYASDDELLIQDHKEKKVASMPVTRRIMRKRSERRNRRNRMIQIQFPPLLLLQWPRLTHRKNQGMNKCL